MFWFWLIAMMLIIGGGGTKAIFSNRNKNKAITTKVNLSWPAKQILKKYNELPVENRPMGDISSLLVALDVKHGVDKVNNHYRGKYSWESYAWTSCDKCRYPSMYGRCTEFNDYTNLRNAVDDVAKELEKQRHALEVAKVQPDLDDIATLTERLRQEKQIINSVTKELT